MREIVGIAKEDRVARATSNVNSQQVKETEEAWKKLAEEIYESRSKDHNENLSTVRRIQRCPNFTMILAHILRNKMGFRAREVDWTSEMVDWGEEESRRVGLSFALFLRKRKTVAVAVDAWKKQYKQLEVLFVEVIGFDDFMVTLANRTLRDSIYGNAFRVSVGAALITIDGATDIYVIATYYQSDALVG